MVGEVALYVSPKNSHFYDLSMDFVPITRSPLFRKLFFTHHPEMTQSQFFAIMFSLYLLTKYQKIILLLLFKRAENSARMRGLVNL